MNASSGILLVILKGKCTCSQRVRGLSENLDELEHSAVINGMKFNKGKCQVLHLGCSNARHRHRLGNEWLENSSEGRDVKVLVTADSI